jgi:outer membrane putative beta-barrel porin/alpha-amylase
MKRRVLQARWFGVGTSRTTHWSILLLGFLVMVPLGGKGSATAAEPSVTEGPSPDYNWQVGVAPTYTSGTYGSDTRTNIFYLPFSVKRFFPDGDITLVVPYVSIEGTGAVRLVGGVGTRTSKSPGSGSGTGKGKKVTDTPQDTASSSSGLGDVILRGRYYLVEETSTMPLIALTARVKMPTADADAGLGTGEFDEGLGVEFTKKLSERWRGFLDGGYTVIGDPEGVTFRNQWWYDIGAGYDVNKNLNLSLYYEEYRALVTTINNSRDLFFSAFFKPTSALRCTGSFLVGLSNGAPNYGLTAGLGYRF